MTCAVCPNCGTDLERFEPVERGDLSLTAHQIRWAGKRVRLSVGEKIIVGMIVRAKGIPVSYPALSDAIGSKEDSDDRDSIIRVLICRARKTFRALDPSFAAIETVRGFGVRWAA